MMITLVRVFMVSIASSISGLAARATRTYDTRRFVPFATVPAPRITGFGRPELSTGSKTIPR